MDSEQSSKRQKFMKQLLIEGRLTNFEVDSEAAVTLMNADQAQKLLPNHELQESSLQFVLYCKNSVKVLGSYKVCVTYENDVFNLNLYVSSINREPLRACEWIREFLRVKGANGFFFRFSLSESRKFNNESFVKSIPVNFPNVVKNNLSPMRGLCATLILKSDAKFVFLKARSLLFRLVSLVEKELEFLERKAFWKELIVRFLQPQL